MSYLGPVSSNQDGTIINYIPYGTIENNTTRGWSACTLTWSGNAPSGAPTLTATQMAISASSVSPLSSLYSLLLTKSAANAQYQGFVSDAFTIKREDLAKVLTGSFYYEVASGTIDMSGSSTQSLEIWVYNVNANQWIQPAGYRGLNQSSGPGLVSFTFQTDSTAANNSYRIAVITQQTSTAAYTVKFDNFKLSPQTAPIGPVVTDWVSYTPTGSWVSGATYTGKYRRVGDSIQCSIKIAITGAVTATDLQVSIPSGFSIDTAKMASGDFLQSVFGTAHAYDVSTLAHYNLQIGYASPTLLFFTVQNQLTGQVISVTNTAPQTWANGDAIHATFMVPVVGASSNVQLSNDTDTRVVDLKVNNASSITPSGTIGTSFSTATNINFNATPVKDSHSGYSAGVYTIPVSGDYFISARVEMSHTSSTGTFVGLSVGVNNVERMTQGIKPALSNAYPFVSGLVTGLVAGDQIAIRLFGDSSAKAFVTSVVNDFTVHRLSGPSVVAASETVAARYRTNASQSLPNNIQAPIDFSAIKESDTHNAYRAGSGYNSITGTYTVNPGYVCPVSGFYAVSAGAMSGSSAWVAINHTFIIFITKNGTNVAPSSFIRVPSTGTYQLAIAAPTSIFYCNAGDVLNASVFNLRGASTSLDPDSLYTYINIERIN